MNIIIIDKRDTTIKTANKTIIIDDKKVPFHLIDTLLIVGKVSLNTADITTITDNGVKIILLSYNFSKSSIINTSSSKLAELKLSQYKAITTNGVNIAKFILKAKINSHISQLKKHDIKVEIDTIFDKIDTANSLDTLLGIEGSFSKLYFGHYFSLFPKTLHKSKRSKKPPLDPLNALLSWNYMLFYNIIAVRLMGYGFEVGLGFLHRPFRDHMALSSDILELFRADINEFVYEIFTKKIVTTSDFSKKGGVYLRYDGRKKLYKPFREFQNKLDPKIDSAITELRREL
jgi:CRISPR-associated protein Cas1